MERNIDYLKGSRQNCLNLVRTLSIEQLSKIPQGFKNSILWNVGHLAVTQQLLCYGLSNLPMQIDGQIIENFRKGSSPKDTYTQLEWEEVLERFITLPEVLAEDWKNSKFTEFNAYKTSFGVDLNSIEDAIGFNNIHEGIHIGYIMALKKLV